MANKTIKVDMLARVEGEGAFKVVLKNGQIESTEFRIFEPPRFYEAFLRGRSYAEVPDITARICGICPVAYQMSSVHAMEAAFGVKVGGPLRELRRLLYCGEWIESHVLHAAMLHAPDFLGFEGAFDMAAAGHAATVKLALDLKKAGNDIVNFIGGREIHPINVRVGGFYKVPRKKDFKALRETLQQARPLAEAFIDWTASLPYPDYERDYTMVSLRHPNEYPFSEGHIVSSKGLDIPQADYPKHFVEKHVPQSNALHGYMVGGKPYLCGPLPRWNLNYDKLPEPVKAAAKRVGVGSTVNNPFRSIVVRALETLFAVDEALRVIENYEEPDAPSVAYETRAATGCAATEAPRGMLFHRYKLAEDGTILEAQIVPPTSQNQASIEEDLAGAIAGMLDQPEDVIRHRCEQTIRNYDPCISCATHFLKLDIVRG